MHIIHILENADDTYGGPARSVPYLATQLQRLGHSVELRTTYSDEKEHNSVCEEQKIKLKRYHTYGPRKLRFSRRFLKDLACVITAKKDEKTILHVHNLRTRTTFVAYLMKRRFPENVTLIVSPRGSLFAWSLNQKKGWKQLLGALFQKHMLRIADSIHVTSEDEQAAVETYVDGCDIQVISNGIDLDEFQVLPSKEESAEYFDLNIHHTHVLFLGRVHIKKGFDRVVDAFISLARDYPDMVLLIAGPKEDLSLWEKSYVRLQEAGLLSRVKDLGMVREKERAYAFTLADIFVLPSETENFGIVIAEALACEDIVIVSDNTPWHDINGLQAGYCVPLKDFTQTWEKVLRLPREERDAIGKRGREYVYQNYDWKILGDAYEKMYALRVQRTNTYLGAYKYTKDYTSSRLYDKPKISVITISRHHLFEMAKALSKIHTLYQFFSCFPGSVRYGIRAAKNIFYPTINYYLVQVCALLPIIRKKKNRYARQTKRFGEEIKKDYKPCDILITNVGSADALLQDIKKQGTRIIIEQGSTCMRKQAALLQEEYARWGKVYNMPSQEKLDHNDRIFELADLVTIPSVRVRRSFEEYNFHVDKLFQNKYGVKTEIFYDRGGRRTDKFILINAGSQELRKGTLYSLQAWQKLKLPNAEFWVIGTILPDLQDLAAPYKSDPTIKFMRSQSQDTLARLFSQASCFLITSIEEGLATTPMQGMACGLPLISNINSGGEDCIIEGHNGRMAKTRDVDDIASKIQWMYDHRDACISMGKNAATYIQEKHSRDGYAQRAYEKYLTLL